MTYIENVFICIAIPLILSMLFTRGRARSFTVFITIGMTVSLLSAYVSGFFMSALGADTVISAIEITPVSEEVMKLLPTLFWFLIYEPDIRKLPDVAIGIAVGFATFENVCFLAENGAEDIRFMLIRGFRRGLIFSAGLWFRAVRGVQRDAGADRYGRDTRALHRVPRDI
ncbi:MAG: PrsW family glutamic-type intramembrane protease [Eubacteriales bacterium]